MSRYKCFLDSKEAEKGSDCLESFRSMQQCFAENPEHYKVLSLHPCAREVTPSGARLQRPLPVVASEISCHLTHVCPVWARSID